MNFRAKNQNWIIIIWIFAPLKISNLFLRFFSFKSLNFSSQKLKLKYSFSKYLNFRACVRLGSFGFGHSYTTCESITTIGTTLSSLRISTPLENKRVVWMMVWSFKLTIQRWRLSWSWLSCWRYLVKVITSKKRMDVLETTFSYVGTFAQNWGQHAPAVKIDHSNFPGIVKLAALQQEIVN